MPNKNHNLSDSEIPIKLQINRYEVSGNHTVLGYVNTTLSKLVNGNKLVELDEETRGRSYTLKINKCEVTRTASFLDYINNGCEMCLITGIDFTGSNVNTQTGYNLHDPDFRNNQYFQAIQQVSNILLSFDNDKQVPLFGFGAMIDSNYYSQVSHCFALNGNMFRPEVNGIEGIER